MSVFLCFIDYYGGWHTMATCTIMATQTSGDPLYGHFLLQRLVPPAAPETAEKHAARICQGTRLHMEMSSYKEFLLT